MFCKYCGSEIKEDDAFCANCGAKVNEAEEATEVVQEPEIQQTYVEPEKKPAKCWAIFEKVGRILSIVGLATSWIYSWAFMIAPVAIVFGILGKKSGNPDAEKISKSTIKKSIWALVIGTIVCIIIGMIYGIALSSAQYSIGKFY